VKQNYDILMTDSTTYDAHTPVEWMLNYVAKIKEVGLNSKVEAKPLNKEEGTKAKGWAGMPIM
jgi:hypothetical protein